MEAAAMTARAPVCVVIPCYNCAGTIKRAMDSVAAQTCPPAQVIIVHDGSSDSGRTREVLAGIEGIYSRLFEVKIIDLAENRGPANARNIGWGKATEPYIAFLDADDAWHPEKIMRQYYWMAANSSVCLTGHPVVCMEEGEVLPSLSATFVVRKINKLSILRSNPFSTPSVMLKRDIPHRFVEGRRYAEDQLLWFQMILSGNAACLLEAPMAFLYKARYGGGKGLSNRLWEMEKGELNNYHQIWKAGHIGAPAAFFFILYSLAKYCRRVVLPRQK